MSIMKRFVRRAAIALKLNDRDEPIFGSM